MTNFPSGEWSPLLIGDQWPDDQDLTALERGKTNRGNITAEFMHFADMLRNAQTGPLIGQQGHTADDLRDAFRKGDDHARRVAEKNSVKASAYANAYDSMRSLQHDLTGIAEDGNEQIKEIQDSKQPVETKVTQILAVIARCRALANLAAAKYGGNVLDAIQRILGVEATGQSARQFAQAHGVDPGQMFRQPSDQKNLDGQVRGLVENAGSPSSPTPQSHVPPRPNPEPGYLTGQVPQLGESGGRAPAEPNAEHAYSTALAGGQTPPQVSALGGRAPSAHDAEHAYPPTLTGGPGPPQVGVPGGRTAPGLNVRTDAANRSVPHTRDNCAPSLVRTISVGDREPVPSAPHRTAGGDLACRYTCRIGSEPAPRPDPSLVDPKLRQGPPGRRAVLSGGRGRATSSSDAYRLANSASSAAAPGHGSDCCGARTGR